MESINLPPSYSPVPHTEIDMPNIKVLGHRTEVEKQRTERLREMLRDSPLPAGELLSNLGLYLKRQTLSRILLMQEIYQAILPVHGVIIEFGVRWGQNLALFSALRGMYEPFNYSRRVIGFDTWEGFRALDSKDGPHVAANDYGVSAGYVDYLEELLALHEADSPIEHKRKFELIQGDATETFGRYLQLNPHTVVALAYFDFDLYAPTKRCLELLLERVTRGSVIAFDELNHPEFPGETLAVMETVGLSRYAIRRSPLNPFVSYMVIDR
jgi:hypothetical protein